MGKKNKKSSAKTKAKKTVGNAHKSKDTENGPPTPQYSVDQILDKTDEYIDSFQYDLAQKFCQRALELDADNLRALETSGLLCLELGNMDAAKHCFGRAIELNPEEGHSKYMYMGQLMTGQHAVQCFQKGIELMTKLLQARDSEQESAGAAEDEGISVKDISSAHCSVAEIYMTDECDDEEADMKCKAALEQALQLDDGNADVFHLFASYCLSKEDKETARTHIEKGVSLWLPEMKEASQAEGAALDPVQSCSQSYPSRVNAAKILIEVASYELATEVLELLLDEDDEVVEVWYLLGWMNHLQDEEYKSNARFFLSRAKEVAEKTKFEDESVKSHIEELLTQLGPDEEEKDNGDEDEDEMETDSEAEEQDEITNCSNNKSAMDHE